MVTIWNSNKHTARLLLMESWFCWWHWFYFCDNHFLLRFLLICKFFICNNAMPKWRLISQVKTNFSRGCNVAFGFKQNLMTRFLPSEWVIFQNEASRSSNMYKPSLHLYTLQNVLNASVVMLHNGYPIGWLKQPCSQVDCTLFYSENRCKWNK